MYVYASNNHTLQATCQGFLVTSFGSKVEPSSGHYTGAEKVEMGVFCIKFMVKTVQWLIYYNWQYRHGRHKNL
jgi:hypothetical protein